MLIKRKGITRDVSQKQFLNKFQFMGFVEVIAEQPAEVKEEVVKEIKKATKRKYTPKK